jgi:hypothetical protein
LLWRRYSMRKVGMRKQRLAADNVRQIQTVHGVSGPIQG